MSITLHIYYSGTNGNARKFAEEMLSTGIVEEIRRESGNLQYAYFYPQEDAESVLLIDSWEDQAALDHHHSAARMERIAALREKYDLHMKVERFLPADSPEGDARFIRE